ncbi:MAG: peptide chain release factor N(5)-glutamine methyltransferase [OM182 bacterium]|nr:MAG: peptide chain release factor N(5)-glutamine methyltransferase [OM182 bacterium]
MAEQQPPLTIASWLRQQGSLARPELEVALCHALDCSRAHLLSHPEQQLTCAELKQLSHWTHQLRNHIPLAYLTGEQEFWGLSLSIDVRVLVPRPDTEILVECALECLPDAPASTQARALQALDLGTGSGAIALAIAQERRDVDIHACDISAECLAVAEVNSRALGLPISLRLSDWFERIDQRFHVIVANPPYIDSADPHLSQLQAEPRAALVAQNHGLADLQAIIERAPAHLHRDGWLLLEHGYDQGMATRELLTNRGFEQVGTRRDLGGNERVSWGQLPVHEAD